MFKQIIVPTKQNASVTMPAEWYGMEVVVLAYPITDKQTTKKKSPTWLSGNSRIDNPVFIGKNFKKISFVIFKINYGKNITPYIHREGRYE
jgi:hypothetical protein